MSNEKGRNPMTFDDHLARVRVVGKWCCWRLPNAKTNGYVPVQIAKKQGHSHRIFYKHLIGPIPRGKQLDHLCRRRWCCNPNHVEPVTQRVNLLRGAGIVARNARRKRCPRGHHYDRLVKVSGNRKHRRCKRCDAAASLRYYNRKKS